MITVRKRKEINQMKYRIHITEICYCGHMESNYNVDTEQEALEILRCIKELNEPAYIRIERQSKKWYQIHWRTVKVIAKWGK